MTFSVIEKGFDLGEGRAFRAALHAIRSRIAGCRRATNLESFRLRESVTLRSTLGGRDEMAGDKVTVQFEINDDAEKMLDEIVSKFGLPDRSKAIRILLDYVAEDGDQDEIFGEIRCRRCA